ncbi:hypothetical protein [Stackebrandtia soli]|uniref:hypothetical protein n=1 Tax=Stackebrandtia soli TaxID=1892856 RepID=UPI0039E97864
MSDSAIMLVIVGTIVLGIIVAVAMRRSGQQVHGRARSRTAGSNGAVYGGDYDSNDDYGWNSDSGSGGDYSGGDSGGGGGGGDSGGGGGGE